MNSSGFGALVGPFLVVLHFDEIIFVGLVFEAVWHVESPGGRGRRSGQDGFSTLLNPPISSPLTVQLFKILEIDPKFQASYNLQTPLANSNLFLTNSSLSDWNGGSAGRPIDQT